MLILTRKGEEGIEEGRWDGTPLSLNSMYGIKYQYTGILKRANILNNIYFTRLERKPKVPV